MPRPPRRLEGVRESSPKRAEALAKAGDRPLAAGPVTSSENKPEEAKAEVARPSSSSSSPSRPARTTRPRPPTRTSWPTPATWPTSTSTRTAPRTPSPCWTRSPRPSPIKDKAPSEEEAAQRTKLIERMLRALIGTGQVNRAIDEMKALEASGGTGPVDGPALLQPRPAPGEGDGDPQGRRGTAPRWRRPRRPIRSSSTPWPRARRARATSRWNGPASRCSPWAPPTRPPPSSSAS